MHFPNTKYEVGACIYYSYNGALNKLRPKHVSRAVRMEEWMDACFNMRRRWSNPLLECTKSESQSVDLFRICRSVDPSANHMYVFPQDIDLTRSTPFHCEGAASTQGNRHAYQAIIVIILLPYKNTTSPRFLRQFKVFNQSEPKYTNARPFVKY